MNHDPGDMALLVAAGGALLSLVCLLCAVRAARRQRLIDNLPTSKTSGVFIGLVELKGTAEAERPLVSYLAEAPCVYYTWSAEEHWSRTMTETYRDAQGRTQTRTHRESGWTTVGQGGEQTPFYLRDDFGAIRIMPEGASLEPLEIFEQACGESDPLYYAKGPRDSVAHSDHERRFCESAIPVHAPIYVVGHARERQDVVAPEIARHPDGPLFLISTRTERQVSGGLAGRFWGLGVLGLVPCVGAFVLRSYMLREVPAEQVTTCVTVGLGYLAAWTLGWVWMVYNSLVDLRQRVKQAWANVDVQLKRRNDLIPNLVRTVEGLRDYERCVQTELAELRSQLLATPPGEPGPDPQACTGLIAAIVERYPELRADDAFLRLQRNLVDTEQRIALARGYFNDIATFYNTRLQTVPERYVAALGALRPQRLLEADHVERVPAPVCLTS